MAVAQGQYAHEVAEQHFETQVTPSETAAFFALPRSISGFLKGGRVDAGKPLVASRCCLLRSKGYRH